MALTRIKFTVTDDEIRSVTLAPWTNDTGYSTVPSYVTGSDGLVYKSTVANGVDHDGNNIGAGAIDPVTDVSGTWEEFATTGAVGGGKNKAFYENDTIVTDSYTITTGKNAMSAGPIQVGDPKTITLITSDGVTIAGTTSTDHGLNVSDSVEIQGTTNYNGTYTINAVPTSTTFEILDSLNVANENAGTVERVVVVTVPTGSEWTVV